MCEWILNIFDFTEDQILRSCRTTRGMELHIPQWLHQRRSQQWQHKTPMMSCAIQLRNYVNNHAALRERQLFHVIPNLAAIQSTAALDVCTTRWISLPSPWHLVAAQGSILSNVDVIYVRKLYRSHVLLFIEYILWTKQLIGTSKNRVTYVIFSNAYHLLIQWITVGS